MAPLDTYLQFILDYAPYFYYIPGTGVDIDAGRGVGAAAFSIDFLYEAYNNGKFEILPGCSLRLSYKEYIMAI